MKENIKTLQFNTMTSNNVFIFLKLAVPVFLFLFFFLSSPYTLGAQEIDPSASPDTLVLNYYTGKGCPSCKKIDAYIDEIDSRHEDLVIRKFEVYNNKDNFKKMIAEYNKFGIGWDRQWVPVIFFEDLCLTGYTEILEKLYLEIVKRLNIPPF